MDATILDVAQKFFGPNWDKSGALADLNSENPSEGAKAFKEVVQFLNSQLQVKSPYHRAMESVYVISSQNYLDEESRKNALLQIQTVIQQAISPAKSISLNEENITKIKMAFTLGNGVEFTRGFIQHMHSCGLSLTNCTKGDFVKILTGLNGVSCPEDSDKFDTIANILKAVFPLPAKSQVLTEEEISKIRVIFNEENRVEFSPRFIEALKKDGSPLKVYKSPRFYRILIDLYGSSSTHEDNKFATIANALEEAFSPAEKSTLLSEEKRSKIKTIFELEGASSLLAERFIESIEKCGWTSLSSGTSSDYSGILLPVFGPSYQTKVRKIADILASTFSN